ncbi:MAG TPA: hypothetical protein VK168_06880 [Saprospiraceae bacterium]|nr:hypothetical protein [Saprospiraceae bacterium]
MNNSYLLEIIKVLTPKHLDEFLKHLEHASELGYKNIQDQITLFKTIKATGPTYSNEELEKEKIYTKVFPGKNPIPGKLEKLMVELTKELRNFLLQKRYIDEKNEHKLQLDWISWLRENGLDMRAHQVMVKSRNSIEKDQEESLDRYRLDFLYAEEEHELQSLHNQFNGNLFITELIEFLDRYYYNYRLELSNRYLLHQKSLPLPNLNTDTLELPSIVTNSLLYQISIKIKLLFELENPTPEAFYDLMLILKNNETKISFQTQSQYYAFLRTLCTIIINSGKTEFAEVLHQIHQDNLERGLFFINNEIASHAYTNIIHIAIRVKEYQWALEFTEKYKTRIIGGDPNQFFYQMNLSLCLFALKRYDEAINNLPDPSLHLHYQGFIRCLELKIYYEMQSDLLLYKMYAFRKYFERTATKLIPANWRTMYIEFFNIMLQLTQSPPKDKKRSQQLIDRINKKKLLADRAWLLEKARELG